VVVGVFAIGVGAAIAMGAPLEFDEAVYAVQARDWAGGTPATVVAEYRPPGLPAIGALLIALGGNEPALRTVGLAFGVVAVIGVYALGRTVSGARTGILAAAAFAAAHTVQARSAQFLTDVPATACLVLCALAMVNAFERSRWILLPAAAAPLAAAAYYLRYGSALPIALMALAALVIWREQLSPRHLLAAGAVLGVLLAPHLIESTISFGAPWKRASFAVQAAGRAYAGEGVVDYATWLPFALAGPIAGIVMLAGLVRAALPRLRPAGRIPAFLVGTAITHIVVLGLIAHGEARFVFLPVALLCVVGAGALATWVPARLDAIAAVVLVLTMAGGGIAAVDTTRGAGERRRLVREAAALATTDLGDDCVLLSRREAEVAWYSGCATYRFGDVPVGVQPDRAILFRGDDPGILPPEATSYVADVDRNGIVQAHVYDLR